MAYKKVNHFETFMQRIVSLGVAASYIAKRSPDNFKRCKDVAAECDIFLKQFRELPRWKKWILNVLLS